MEKSAAQDMKNLLVANGMTSRAAGRVVEILEPMGYFEIPASMTYHGAWPGGLFEHSWAVTKQLVCLTDKLGLKWQMRRSPVLVGMLHDLCKRDCEEYEQRRAYERRFASVDSMPQTQTVYKMIYEQKKRGGKQ